MRFFTDETADTSSAWQSWPGGTGTFWVRFSSGTGDVKLEISPPGPNTTALGAMDAGTDTTFTTTGGDGNFTLGTGMLVRATMANGATTPIVDAGTSRVPQQ